MEIKKILNKLDGVKSRGNGKYQAKCPAHDDQRASLSLEDTNEKILIYCHAGCDTEKVLNTIGLSTKDLFKDNSSNYEKKVKQPKKQIEKVYQYTDEKGNVIHEKVRYTNKTFYNRHKKDGKVIWNMRGITPVIYNLPKVVQAVKEGKNIFIVEGEKDADLLNSMGLVATTNYEGAGKGKFKKRYVKYFTGANVVVIQDNDKAGKEAAETIINLLLDVVKSIKYIDLNHISKKDGFDITDYFDIGYTKKEFLKMVKDTPKIDRKKAFTLAESEGNTQGKQYTQTIYNNYTTKSGKILYNSWYSINNNTGKRSLIPGILAEYLAENIPAVYTTGRFYIYKNGVYNICDNHEEKTIVMDHIMTPLRRTRDINDVTNQWSINKKIRISPDEINKDPFILNLKNGLYDIRTKELKKHTPEVITTIQLNAKYNPTAKGPVFDKFINEIVPDKDNRLLVQEMLGYSITTFNNAKKVFILEGRGDTGKSTFLNIIEDMLGSENISNVMLQKIGDRFNIAQLYGKVANIFADLPNTPLTENSTFKALTGGDKIQGERKGQDPFEFYNKAKLIFSCNELPANYGDRSDAFYNRLIIIPFDNPVPKEKQDPFLRDKLKEELDYIFLWAMEGLERLINNNFIFTENKATNSLLENYKINSNNALSFLNNNCELDENCYTHRQCLYNAYKEYCLENGLKHMSSIKFYDEVLKYDSNIISDDNTRVPGTRKRAFKGIKLIKDLI